MMFMRRLPSYVRPLMHSGLTLATLALVPLALAPRTVLHAQGTAADYARADSLNSRFRGLLLNVVERVTWTDSTHFWYRRSVRGGNDFVMVDARSQQKTAPFDHERLATALNAARAGTPVTGVTLPFQEFTFDGASAVRFAVDGVNYRCVTTDYACARVGGNTPGTGARRLDAAAARTWQPSQGLAALFGAPDPDALPDEGPWVEDDGLEAEVRQQQLMLLQPRTAAADSNVVRSPDGKWDAFIRNFNVYMRPVVVDSARARVLPGAAFAAPRADNAVQLTWDGSEGKAYAIGPFQNRSLRWSPDSKKIAVYRVTPGYARMVKFIESSPVDQLQPKFNEQYYQKPGDAVTVREPVLIDVASRSARMVNNTLFPNAYQLSAIQWWSDSRAFTFEYNQRGHQVYRVIEVDANSADARALISDEPKTFFSYRPAADNLSEPGSRYRRDVNDGREIIWMSERDGWKHLYLYDGRTARVKNQITKGTYVVRNVQRVDTVGRRIWFSAGGRDAGQDPYLTKYYRIGFDGTGLVEYTPENGTHVLTWSPDLSTYVDSWTRTDLPAVTVLKRASDQKVIMPLETGDASALVAAGYQMAEPFVAKGRDGTTDIYGVIVRPTNFDPSKRYPVIEQIYAGPQGSFVPKTFAVGGATRTLAEHGFIVVQIDGMGTANRSKAFHDVAWQNLGDAGFPDRILWHKAVAAKYPSYDISRVGIYGTSAGGQNAMGAMLFHPEFYKAAFSAAGCHDNRMDKMWWNEQWMGWPLGPHYAAASNVDNAHKLQGDVLLVVGELDTNVDPASTYQVVNALIKANKMFDLLVLPGAGHTNGGAYGVRKMTDFFVRSLHRVTPPVRNSAE